MLDRRKLLTGSISVVTFCLPGCSGDSSTEISGSPEPPIGPAELSGHVRPESPPETVPGPLECESRDFERFDAWATEKDLQWGELYDDSDKPVFGLRVNKLIFDRGDTVEITLTNMTDQVQQTANPHKSDFQIRTEAGWQDVRGWIDGQPRPITDELIGFDPGETYTWTFDLTADGIVEGSYPAHEPHITVCPGLPPGRYRFATSAPLSGDVAVSFSLES